REKVLGSLERGKYADLLVLNSDYFTVPEREIRKIKPMLTMVGGKIVYQAPNF
ncbi:MAG TPA: amidohydrolase family protein, partial [Candidatus Binatia bacterium]